MGVGPGRKRRRRGIAVVRLKVHRGIHAVGDGRGADFDANPELLLLVIRKDDIAAANHLPISNAAVRNNMPRLPWPGPFPPNVCALACR